MNNIKAIPTTKWHFPIIINTNARSLVSKMNELKSVCDQSGADVVCITETWCRDAIPDAPVNLVPYTILRNDRQNRVGGGVIAYVRNTLTLKHWSDLEDEDFETLWFTIRPRRLPRQFTCIMFGIVYHPPSDDDQALAKHITKSLDTILRQHPSSGIVLAGDFNSFKERFITQSFGLKQIVTKPTRAQAVLDKIYTNISDYYRTLSIEPPLGQSDHNIVLCQPTGVTMKNKPCITVKEVRISDPTYRAMFGEALRNTNWTPIYHLETTEEQYEFFVSKIHSLLDAYLPIKTIKTRSNDRPWITDSFKMLVSKKQRAWHEKRFGLYKYLKNKVNRESKSLQRRFYEQKITEVTSGQPKQLWNVINQVTGERKSTDRLQGLCNNLCDGNQLEFVEKIGLSLQSVSDDLTPLTSDDLIKVDCEVPSDLIIFVEAVERSLLSLKVSKAVGPDRIPNWVLRDYAGILGRPIACIFNSSIRLGSLPQMWRSADVIPLPKVANPIQIEKDLRPKSLPLS